MFRRPKKPIQRRVYSAEDDAENGAAQDDDSSKMDIVQENSPPPPPPPTISNVPKDRKSEKKNKDSNRKVPMAKSSLLSFGDEEDEGEVFQVKKTSQSKKVMKMMDKERRKKKKIESSGGQTNSSVNANSANDNQSNNGNSDRIESMEHFKGADRTATSSTDLVDGDDDDDVVDDLSHRKRSKNPNSDSSSHTEIRTDDFVLVVKKSEPMQILNGRAALCAGRDDMSSEDEEEESSETKNGNQHAFNKPDRFRSLLESGAIPDAAMIHEARKKRQKARELGDYVKIEENKPTNKSKGRLVRDDVDDDISDDEERVNMAGITAAKEREERMEKFYSMRNNSDDDSDLEMDEWENQQIRKGVTGAQLLSAQQESAIYSQYLRSTSPIDLGKSRMSTGNLLEQAYARSTLEKPRKLAMQSQKAEKKATGPRMPAEVFSKMCDRLTQVKDLNASHLDEIDRITRELQLMKFETLQSEQNAPIAASKYRYYQELRCFVQDLVECLDEKLPKIVELERKANGLMAKQATVLIERRRQDTRDQAKESTQKHPPIYRELNAAAKKEEDDRIRRTAEREGRRTRRRRDRERNNISATHLDGMSSDDEIPDQDAVIYKNQMKQLQMDAVMVFEDVTDDFCEIPVILERFESWRLRDRSTYTDTYFSLCLPKIVGPMIRLKLLTWNPLDETCVDFEKMDWFEAIMKYGFDENETESSLADDPDVRLVPTLIEKIILPKLMEVIESCWDPMSSSQTLRLVNLIRRLLRDYPSLRVTSKNTRAMLIAVLDKIKLTLENDVFIPIFPKQIQESKSSFFQRQFSSALKLFRNLLSWEGILSDSVLKEIAILSLLNRYLLSGLRVCQPIDAVSKAHYIVNTLPRIWLQQEAILESLELFIGFLRTLLSHFDRTNPMHIDPITKISKILCSLQSSIKA